jgi:hypothetical protein
MSHEFAQHGGTARRRAAKILFSQHLLHHLYALIVARNRAYHGGGADRTATEEFPERGPATSSAVSIAQKNERSKPSRAGARAASAPTSVGVASPVRLHRRRGSQ